MREEMFGRRETYGLWYELFCMALKGMNMNLSGGVFSSGELYLLNFLKRWWGNKKEYIFFDVGANKGEYTKSLMGNFPDAKIYCFEPAAGTYRMLKENIGINENVVLNNFALSDQVQEGRLYYDQEGSGLASLYNRQLDYHNIDFSKSEVVNVGTLDDYCEKNQIAKIDFLKMDIEGNELKALKGAAGLLEEERIDVIQMEFGGCNIDSRTYFRDFWNLLSGSYYAYRILKNGLWKITGYTERLECFGNTNYAFIRKDLLKDCEGDII